MVPFYCLLYNGLWKNNIWENDYTKAKINFKNSPLHVFEHIIHSFHNYLMT